MRFLSLPELWNTCTWIDGITIKYQLMEDFQLVEKYIHGLWYANITRQFN